MFKAKRIVPFLAVIASFAVGGCASHNPNYDPQKPHHRPDGFANPEGAGRLGQFP